MERRGFAVALAVFLSTGLLAPSVVYAQQIKSAKGITSVPPSQLASFQHARFAKSSWMNALYNEDFPSLNEDRISALSYVAGILIVEANDKNDTNCPRLSASTGGDFKAAEMHIMTSVYGVSILALYTGREYRPDEMSEAKAGFDLIGLGNGSTASMLSIPVGRGIRGELAQAGADDAKYLLTHFGGCSGALFKRIYSGIEEFALREAPQFRPANGAPALEIKVAPYKDNFWTEQKGTLYYGYNIYVANHAQLPQTLNIMQGWKQDPDHPNYFDTPPDVAPVIIELFSGDGQSLGERRPDVFFVSGLNREVINFSAPANHHPNIVYLEIYDARQDKVYLSNRAVVPDSLPTPVSHPAQGAPVEQRRRPAK